jgi:hypothetical protein
MELRKTERFKLDGMEGRLPGADGITCAFDFDPMLKGSLTDLGPGGFGIEIFGLSGSQVEMINNLDTYMITIYFDSGSIMAGVKNVWHSVTFKGGSMSLRCGVSIDVISPEDRLKLSGIIGKIRDGR